MFDSPTRRANRRKLFVFAATFLLLAAAGLLYSYSRPAIYLASARVQINPGALQVEAAVSTGGTQGADAARSLLNELPVLTSRPLVKSALEKMAPLEASASSKFGADPLTSLQAGLEASVTQGTDVVEPTSRGPDAQVAANLVNELIVAYMVEQFNRVDTTVIFFLRLGQRPLAGETNSTRILADRKTARRPFFYGFGA